MGPINRRLNRLRLQRRKRRADRAFSRLADQLAGVEEEVIAEVAEHGWRTAVAELEAHRGDEVVSYVRLAGQRTDGGGNWLLTFRDGTTIRFGSPRHWDRLPQPGDVVTAVARYQATTAVAFTRTGSEGTTLVCTDLSVYGH